MESIGACGRKTGWGRTARMRSDALEPSRRSGVDVVGHVGADEGGTAGNEVDDLVRVSHDRHVVLDDHDRLAGDHQPVEHADHLLDIGDVETVGHLVEDVSAAVTFGATRSDLTGVEPNAAIPVQRRLDRCRCRSSAC